MTEQKNFHFYKTIKIHKKIKMDYLYNIIKSINLPISSITYTFQSNDLFIHIPTHTTISKTLEPSIIKSHVHFQHNPQIHIKQINNKTKKTLYLVNNENKFYSIKKYGITIILPYKQNYKTYIENNLQLYESSNNFLKFIQNIKKNNNIKIKLKKNKQITELKMFNNINELRDIKIVGQFNKQCIVGKSNKNMVILDQHAIHERIRYEKMQTKSKNIEYCKSKACKGAIKFGCVLSREKMNVLMWELMKCRYPFICAHGRPDAVIIYKI